ncbi:MAG TPA: hypothetical protein DDX25_01075 [Firmicutes bacterium]|nr:hypothetical protein [Bacillota bacterium]
MYDIGEFIEVRIPQWLAGRKGFDTCYLEGTVEATTDKAMLLKLVDGEEVWLPLKCVEVE